jgi:hypothetical protein
MGENSPNLGSMLLITIFFDLCQFSATKIGVFLNDQCYDLFFQKLAVIWAKNANIFATFFGENILKMITAVPGHPGRSKSRKYFNLLFMDISELQRNCLVGLQVRLVRDRVTRFGEISFLGKILF